MWQQFLLISYFNYHPNTALLFFPSRTYFLTYFSRTIANMVIYDDYVTFRWIHQSLAHGQLHTFLAFHNSLTRIDVEFFARCLNVKSHICLGERLVKSLHLITQVCASAIEGWTCLTLIIIHFVIWRMQQKLLGPPETALM